MASLSPPCCVPLLLLGACGTELPAPTGAHHTDSGVLVWVAADNPALRLQRDDGSGWHLVEADARSSDFGTWWWLDGAGPALRFRLVEGRDAGPAAATAPLDLTLSLAPSHGAVLADEPLLLLLDGDLPGLPLQAALTLDGAPLAPDCLAGGGLLDCRDDGAAPLLLDGPWSAAVTAAPASPALHTLGAAVTLEDVTLATLEAEVLLVGRRLLWGDLHTHSGLSLDGCEDEDQDCAARAAVPGADFFAQARAAQLDFSALTDHAELTMYTAPGGGAPLSIWDTQQAAVQEADGLVTVLGYEWTYVRPERSGGHKTVLLEEVESCDSRRLSASFAPEDTAHPSGALYHDANPHVALSNTELWAALAAAGCAGAGRALTFAHHTAWTPPEMVDWTDPVNAPDPDFEPVVEIHSEHASSECADLSAEGCDWGVTTDREHHPEGAVQTALAQGYRLGFVGGTDSHDARPGSLGDGPSCTGRLDEDGAFICHAHDGALTGIFAGAADLDRAALFDHLLARETAATSGPRPPLRVALATTDGAAHLPGAVVDAGDARLYVMLDDADLDGLELIEAAALTPDNQTRAWTDTLPAILDLSLEPAEAVYLRLRLWDPEAEAEQRIWLSPWFTEEK